MQITLGDLSNPVALRQLVRGAREVVHLAATIRDQPAGSIEELNGVATARLLRHAEAAGAERFLFFGAMGATTQLAHALLPSKALAEQAVMELALNATVMSPSIVYAPGDHWVTLLRRMSLLPVMPIAGSGRASYQPIWAEDVAACAHKVMRDGAPGGARRLELAGPEVLTYEEIVRLALSAWDRDRRLVHIPLWMVQRGLRLLERMFGPTVLRDLGGSGADGGADGDGRRNARTPAASASSRSGWRKCWPLGSDAVALPEIIAGMDALRRDNPWPELPAGVEPFYLSLDAGGRHLVIDVIREHGVTLMLEIGCFLCGSTRQWLDSSPDLEVIGVDPWDGNWSTYVRKKTEEGNPIFTAEDPLRWRTRSSGTATTASPSTTSATSGIGSSPSASARPRPCTT